MRRNEMAIFAGLLLAGCAASAPSPDRIAAPEPVYDVREGMVNAINPPTEQIWNLQVEVMDDYGNFDPDLMDPGHWQALADAAMRLDSAAQDMAAARLYRSHDPDGELGEAPEGTDLAAIQARLDANPQAHNALSVALANHTGQLVDAVEARDPERITALVNDLQPTCKACHDVFWYPEEYQ